MSVLFFVIVVRCMQLKNLNTPELASSSGRVLYDEMVTYAQGITIPAGVTNGTLTQIDRFQTDHKVPPNTRYTVSEKVIQHSPVAKREQLEELAAERKEVECKRARLSP
jgi:hypothetical protein